LADHLDIIDIDALDDDDEIEFDPQLTVIHRFDELLSKFDALLKENDARIRADLARSQTQLEVLATLQTLVREQGRRGRSQVDLGPIKTVLTELQEQQHKPRPTWEFEIDRDNRGFMTRVTAKPQGESLH
jgi:hypothetical protein